MNVNTENSLYYLCEKKDTAYQQQVQNHHPRVSVITRLPSAQVSCHTREYVQRDQLQQKSDNWQSYHHTLPSTSVSSPCQRMKPFHPRDSGDSDLNLSTEIPQFIYGSAIVQQKVIHPTPGTVKKVIPPAGIVIEKYRPCLVCKEKAGKHSYYGGQVCPSCRAFFRRSVQAGYNTTYFCAKDGNCKVSLKTRKNCQCCRYKLCEKAGMKTAWVLTEDERKQKAMCRGKKKSNYTENSAQPSIFSPDLGCIDSYVLASSHCVKDLPTPLLRQIIRLVAFRAKLDEVSQKQLSEVMLARSRSFARRLGEVHELCMEDREEILTHNLAPMVKLATCRLFAMDMTWTKQLSLLLSAKEVDKLDVKLRSLNVTGMDNLCLTYNMVFSTLKQEDTIMKLMVKIGSWAQDDQEYTLLSLVILFCSDMLHLRERIKVEEFQLKFATLLQQYLNNKHYTDLGLARSRFASGMMYVSRCREVGDNR